MPQTDGPEPEGDAAGWPAVVDDMLCAIDDFDVHACDAAFVAAMRGYPPLALVRDVAGPLLREAGRRWQRGRFAIVQEHLLSGVIRHRLSCLLDPLVATARGPVIVFATLGGERHEIGSLMTAVVAAARGFRCIWLGPDLPAAELATYCLRRPPRVLVLSLVTQPEVNDSTGQLGELRRAVPLAVSIWVGGQAADVLDDAHLPGGIRRLGGLEDFLVALDELTTEPQSP